ncbi:MAG: hypothetical protein QNJ63_03300 [Calothrix sp. MO_192.B10]|nr:hypothetical protein [Calothrix sp. MO_192.B10]
MPQYKYYADAGYGAIASCMQVNDKVNSVFPLTTEVYHYST